MLYLLITLLFNKMPNLSSHQRSLIIGMAQAGRPYIDIARQLNIHRNTVSNTVRRFQATGSIQELPRSGRPRVTDAQDDLYIRTSHLRNRFRSAAFTARNLPNQRRISDQTVRNRLKNYGIKPYRPAKRITLNNVHKRNRLAWCNARINWNHNQWRQVLFTDESTFGIQRKRGAMWVYRRPGERYSAFCVDERDRQRGGKLMVWGGISYNGKTALHIVEGNLTAARYIAQIVDPHVLPYLNANPGTIFMQDNATPHAARLTIAHLNNHNVNTLPWPSKSPDFNPIEHLWDALDQKIRKRPNQPRTLADLRQALNEEWQRFPLYIIRRLISSMRRRCQACIAARGGHTRY